MTSLILLNGPPGIGKSTLAARYADDHTGTLNLDIDSLHFLIGGWRELGGRVHDYLRPLALAMAAGHLAGGNDVIVPQYIARADAATAFELVAQAQSAELREVVLLDEREATLDRFYQRPDDTEWARHNRRIVADLGDRDFLTAMYDQLLNYLDARPRAVRIASRPDDVDGSYATLLRVLSIPASVAADPSDRSGEPQQSTTGDDAEHAPRHQ